MNKELIKIFLNFEENKIEISNEGPNFTCDTEIRINEDFKWNIYDDFIPTNTVGYYYSRWHKPSTSFTKDGTSIVNVTLFKKKSETSTFDPYGEELWETNKVLIDKRWEINTIVKQI